MSSTTLHIVIRVWGPNLDPNYISEQSGVMPARTFRRGELRNPGAAIHDVAGWEWKSASTSDDGALWADFAQRISPAVKAIQESLKSDPKATVSVSVVGTVEVDLLTTPEELNKRNYDFDQHTTLPLLDGGTVGLYLTPKVIKILASLNASLDTYMDVKLSDPA